MTDWFSDSKVGVLAALLPIHLPAMVPRKAASLAGNLDEFQAPEFDLACLGHCKYSGSEPGEGRSLLISPLLPLSLLSLYNFSFQIN